MQNFPRIFQKAKYSTNLVPHKNLYLEYVKTKPRFSQHRKNEITLQQHNILNKRVDEIALNTLYDNPGSKSKSKRLGRGHGNGKGREAGRGMMGQKSRPSSNIPNGFEGGQTRIYRRVPKFGFKNSAFKLRYEPVSLEKIQYFIDSGRIAKDGTINLKTLYDSGCITKIRFPGVKITSIGKDNFQHKIDIEIPRATKKAIQAIEGNGGSVRSVYYSKGALIVMRRQPCGVYNFDEIFAKMAMPPPKLFRYYMRSDIRGYLSDSNPVHPLRDVVPPEESGKEKEKGHMRLLNWRKAVQKKLAAEKKGTTKKEKKK